MKKRDNILIVAAHPDDEVLGCGGTLLKMKKKYDINVIFLTNGVSARSGVRKNEIIDRKNAAIKLFKYLKISRPKFFNFPDNKMDTVPLLNIVRKIEKFLNYSKPKIVFTHFYNCLNIDHRITYDAVMTACRPINNLSVKKILSFEIPSSTEWSMKKDKSFQPNYFIDISSCINEKLKLIKFYKKELRKYPHSRSLKSIKSLASYRGSICGVEFAEAFYLNRYLEQ